MERALGGWLDEHLPGAFRLAIALTGNAARACRLVAAALTPALSRSRSPGRLEFPEGHLRTLVVRQFLGGRGAPPGIHDSALDRLSRRERAAIVLRLTEHLTIAETAAIVDRPAQSVAGDLAQAALAVGLDTDGVPVTPYGQETLRALERLVQQPPDPLAAQRLLADATRLRTRRRQRGATLLAVLAAVVAVVALIPLVVLPRLPVKIRQPGEWVMMHRVKPPTGWTIVGRSLAPSSEATLLQRNTTDGSAGDNCVVTVNLPGALDLTTLPAQRENAQIKGHRAFFVEAQPSGDSPLLAWSYAPSAWATVTCLNTTILDRPTLAALADAVEFKPTPIELPFSLSTMPDGYQLDSATASENGSTADLLLARIKLEPGDADLNVTYNADDHDTITGRRVRLGNATAYLDDTTSNARLCIPTQDTHVCVTAYWPLGDWPTPPPPIVGIAPVLISTGQALTLASNLGDRATWFPASAALPH